MSPAVKLLINFTLPYEMNPITLKENSDILVSTKCAKMQIFHDPEDCFITESQYKLTKFINHSMFKRNISTKYD